MGEVLLEIAKLIGPGAIFAVALGYLFARRMEKLKARARLGEEYARLAIAGIGNFLTAFRSLITQLESLERELATGELSIATADEALAAVMKYVDATEKHRVYLVPILPFGTSYEDAGLQALTPIKIYLQLIKSGKSSDDETVQTVRQELQNLKRNYETMCGRANKSISDMQSL